MSDQINDIKRDITQVVLRNFFFSKIFFVKIYFYLFGFWNIDSKEMPLKKYFDWR